MCSSNERERHQAYFVERTPLAGEEFDRFRVEFSISVEGWIAVGRLEEKIVVCGKRDARHYNSLVKRGVLEMLFNDDEDDGGADG